MNRETELLQILGFDVTDASLEADKKTWASCVARDLGKTAVEEATELEYQPTEEELGFSDDWADERITQESIIAGLH